VLIRDGLIEDAAMLAMAEKETAQTPGLLVSRPDELRLADSAKKIAELSKVGRYIVGEEDGRVIDHAFLDPMPLQAISHVFRLTIVVHPGYRSRGIGEALMRELID
jgi:ribosomal protein S18 acetylase RimI-like enzyme